MESEALIQLMKDVEEKGIAGTRLRRKSRSLMR